MSRPLFASKTSALPEHERQRTGEAGTVSPRAGSRAPRAGDVPLGVDALEDAHEGARGYRDNRRVEVTLGQTSYEVGGWDVETARPGLPHAELARVELRELVQGMLPPVLTRSGLHGAGPGARGANAGA